MDMYGLFSCVKFNFAVKFWKTLKAYFDNALKMLKFNLGKDIKTYSTEYFNI